MKETLMAGGVIGLIVVVIFALIYLINVFLAWIVLSILSYMGFDVVGSAWLWGVIAMIVGMILSPKNIVNIEK